MEKDNARFSETIETQIQEYVDIKILPYIHDLCNQIVHIHSLADRKIFHSTIVQILDFILNDNKPTVDKRLVFKVRFLGFFEKHPEWKQNFYDLYEVLAGMPDDMKDYPFMYFRDGKLTPAVIKAKNLPVVLSEEEISNFTKVITSMQKTMRDYASTKVAEVLTNAIPSETTDKLKNLTIFQKKHQL